MVLSYAFVAPEIAVAGEYEDALAAVEAVYGTVGNTNTAEPGGLAWHALDLAITAKQLKNEGKDGEALTLMVEAASLLQPSQ